MLRHRSAVRVQVELPARMLAGVPDHVDGSGIVADMVVEVMVGGKDPRAEADRAQKRAEELLAQLGAKRWS